MKDPAKRITIDEIKNHPWFVSTTLAKASKVDSSYKLNLAKTRESKLEHKVGPNAETCVDFAETN